jgi:AcrR family transcriptional regulator
MVYQTFVWEKGGWPPARFDAAGARPDNGAVTPPADSPPATAGGATQRQHILDTALQLMAQRGVDGTSMRDLASAANLNVASLYHYFPSKRDLLVAVLAEHGYIDDLHEAVPADVGPDAQQVLADLVFRILGSILELEDFVRLMIGEVMRGEETAVAVGGELFSATQSMIERWVQDTQPTLREGPGAAPVARMLRSMIVGLLVEHLAGVLEGDDDVQATFRRRADEMAAVLHSRD